MAVQRACRIVRTVWNVFRLDSIFGQGVARSLLHSQTAHARCTFVRVTITFEKMYSSPSELIELFVSRVGAEGILDFPTIVLGI